MRVFSLSEYSRSVILFRNPEVIDDYIVYGNTPENNSLSKRKHPREGRFVRGGIDRKGDELIFIVILLNWVYLTARHGC